MAAFEQSEDEDEGIAQINIVPFVDIVLVLLIIFLLTSNVIARASLSVDLPQAANAGQAVDSTLNIVVGSDDTIYLDGNALALAELGARVAPLAVADPKVRAVISADKSLRYERVVDIIDVVKGAGVASFALNIQRRGERSGVAP